MHNYYDVHHQFPPAAVCSKDGKSLLSWRVLMLPYVEQEGLYKQFHLDEAWDSPHNLRLLEKMPPVYEVPDYFKSQIPPYHTVCHVFVGKGTMFEPELYITLDDIPDGTANTILIVEAGKPVPWTKPEDLAYDPSGPLPDLPCLFKEGFRAAFADGSVHWIRKPLNEAQLRILIGRNDGLFVNWNLVD